MHIRFKVQGRDDIYIYIYNLWIQTNKWHVIWKSFIFYKWDRIFIPKPSLFYIDIFWIICEWVFQNTRKSIEGNLKNANKKFKFICDTLQQLHYVSITNLFASLARSIGDPFVVRSSESNVRRRRTPTDQPYRVLRSNIDCGKVNHTTPQLINFLIRYIVWYESLLQFSSACPRMNTFWSPLIV